MNEKRARELFRKLKKNVDDVIVSVSRGNVNHAKISNSRINVIKFWETSKIDIFAALGRRTVSCSIEDTMFNVDSVVKRVVSLAKVSSENEDYFGIAEGPFKYQVIKDLYDRKVSNLSAGIGDIAEKCMQEAHKNGASRVAGVIEIREGDNLLLTSENVDVNERGTELYFSLRAFTDKDASGHDIAVSRTIKDWKFEQAARKAAEIAVMARNPENGGTGRFDVLFDPLPFANLLEMVGNAASIFNVEAGLSFFIRSQDKRVASDLVTLHDTGKLPNGLASSKCDAEGFPSRETAIIEKGLFRNYLHNASTARKYKAESTGNAGIIAPHPRNIVLARGKNAPARLIEHIKKGIYVTNVWYTRSTNLMTGDFSTIPRDGIFYIENGKIKHAVKNIRISENILNILKNINAIGNNSRQIKGWEVENPVITPSVLVKGLNITRPLEL